MKVYCAYIDIDNDKSEIFCDGEVTTIDGHKVCDVINLGIRSVCFVPSVKIIKMIYPGGEISGEEYHKNNNTDYLIYQYGKCQFRSFGSVIGMQSTKVLKQMYDNMPISRAMYEYLCDLGDPEKIKYPLAYYAKQLFFDDIRNELWEERKEIKKYYWDEQTYWDMMASNKGGVLSDYRAKYVEDARMYDIRSAYASVMVNDDKFPVGAVQRIAGTSAYMIAKLRKYLSDGVWCKIVFDGHSNDYIRWYDKKFDKTGMEYYNILTLQMIGEFDNFLSYLRTKDFRLYSTKSTGYLNRLVRDKIVRLYDEKESLKHGSLERYFVKTQIEMIYGKGIQHYDFEDIMDIQDHYRGRGDNYLTPEMSNHCLAKVEYDMYKAIYNTTSYYYDTDGIKVKNNKESEDYFEHENKKILARNKKAGYNTDIGTWKYEGTADRMLIYTPKIYIYECDNKIEFRAAGVDKDYKEKYINAIKGDKIMYLRKHGFITASKKYVYDCGKFTVMYEHGDLKGDLQDG